MQIHPIEDPGTRSRVAGDILRRLPQWFGVPSATATYVADCAGQTVLAAYPAPGEGPAGFLALKRHYPASCEVAVMGVDPAWHRRGVGRALMAEAVARCRAQGVRFLTVKTLDASHPDPHYARTRAFYAAMGFTPLERFPELWDPSQPALMLIQYLG